MTILNHGVAHLRLHDGHDDDTDCGYVVNGHDDDVRGSITILLAYMMMKKITNTTIMFFLLLLMLRCAGRASPLRFFSLVT